MFIQLIKYITDGIKKMFNLFKQKKKDVAPHPADDPNVEWVFKIGKKLELIDWLNEIWHTDTVYFKKGGIVEIFGKVALMKWRQTAKGYILYYPPENPSSAENIVRGPWD